MYVVTISNLRRKNADRLRENCAQRVQLLYRTNLSFDAIFFQSVHSCNLPSIYFAAHNKKWRVL